MLCIWEYYNVGMSIIPHRRNMAHLILPLNSIGTFLWVLCWHLKKHSLSQGRRSCEGRDRLECWSYKPRPRVARLSGRGKKGLSPTGFRESMTLSTPWLWTSGLQNSERINFCGFMPKTKKTQNKTNIQPTNQTNPPPHNPHPK